ncbi:hypothetical protein G436_4313 [Leptospira interrogans serovar Hardjo str. Norma]|uniref:Uncharacterized protein n=1 Tax=Leptospira interrogans serovar Hardjo str. Norma TaxID=1279460 RepID=A0A0M4MXN4_LEPIR|nr:hypothetical protein G436_4313 [Leptospira interrogans serovar Hardjo str. Norma]
MWKLLQITTLQINSKIVGIHIFRKFLLVLLRRTHVNL